MNKFFEFIRNQGVVGLAVAFVLGLAINDLVKSLVDNVINPIVGVLLSGAGELMEATVQIGGATIKYGALINSFISFVIIALVVYLSVTKLGLDKLDKKKDE